MIRVWTLAWLVVAVAFVGGCAKTPEATETGFLSDYSRLQVVNDQRMAYAGPELAEYDAYIIDPIEFRLPPRQLNEQQRSEVAEHFRKRLTEIVQKRGLGITDEPGKGVARLRIAMTGVTGSTWWMKLHPASRAMGAGTGGAAMEGEVVDSVTGRQIAAAVQASPGNQFNFTAFKTVDDVKSAIDKWAEQAGHRLDELRGTR
jgi:hypothetical protein